MVGNEEKRKQLHLDNLDTREICGNRLFISHLVGLLGAKRYLASRHEMLAQGLLTSCEYERIARLAGEGLTNKERKKKEARPPPAVSRQ